VLKRNVYVGFAMTASSEESIYLAS